MYAMLCRVALLTVASPITQGSSIATGETAVDFIGEVALDKKDRLGRSKALRTLKTELIPGSSLVEGIENLID